MSQIHHIRFLSKPRLVILKVHYVRISIHVIQLDLDAKVAEKLIRCYLIHG